MTEAKRYPETPEEYALHPDFSEGNLVISTEMAPGGMRKNTSFVAEAWDSITVMLVVDEEMGLPGSPGNRALFVFLDEFDEKGNRLGLIIEGQE